MQIDYKATLHNLLREYAQLEVEAQEQDLEGELVIHTRQREIEQTIWDNRKGAAR